MRSGCLQKLPFLLTQERREVRLQMQRFLLLQLQQHLDQITHFQILILQQSQYWDRFMHLPDGIAQRVSHMQQVLVIQSKPAAPHLLHNGFGNL